MLDEKIEAIHIYVEVGRHFQTEWIFNERCTEKHISKKRKQLDIVFW